MSTNAAAWLRERKKCTLATAFKDIRDYVECYVSAANEMSIGPEKTFPFEIENGSGLKPRFVIRGFPFGSTKQEDRVTVEFVLNDHDITVSHCFSDPERDVRTGNYAEMEPPYRDMYVVAQRRGMDKPANQPNGGRPAVLRMTANRKEGHMR